MGTRQRDDSEVAEYCGGVGGPERACGNARIAG